MTSFKPDSFQKKLFSLDGSQESIQTLSLWIIHHRAQHPHIIDTWFDTFPKATSVQQLNMLYLANDVIQIGVRKKCPQLRQQFQRQFHSLALPHLAKSPFKAKIHRIFTVWRQRGVYDPDYCDNLIASLGMAPAAAADPPAPPAGNAGGTEMGKATARAVLPDSYRLEATLDLVKRTSMLDRITEVSMKTRQCCNKTLDSADVDNMRQIKARAEALAFKLEFDQSVHKIEDLVKVLERQIATKKMMLESLGHARTFFSQQMGEATVVQKAYSQFEGRIRTMKRKVDEKKLSLAASNDSDSPPDRKQPASRSPPKRKRRGQSRSGSRSRREESNDDEGYDPVNFQLQRPECGNSRGSQMLSRLLKKTHGRAKKTPEKKPPPGGDLIGYASPVSDASLSDPEEETVEPAAAAENDPMKFMENLLNDFQKQQAAVDASLSTRGGVTTLPPHNYGMINGPIPFPPPTLHPPRPPAFPMPPPGLMLGGLLPPVPPVPPFLPPALAAAGFPVNPSSPYPSPEKQSSAPSVSDFFPPHKNHHQQQQQHTFPPPPPLQMRPPQQPRHSEDDRPPPPPTDTDFRHSINHNNNQQISTSGNDWTISSVISSFRRGSYQPSPNIKQLAPAAAPGARGGKPTAAAAVTVPAPVVGLSNSFVAAGQSNCSPVVTQPAPAAPPVVDQASSVAQSVASVSNQSAPSPAGHQSAAPSINQSTAVGSIAAQSAGSIAAQSAGSIATQPNGGHYPPSENNNVCKDADYRVPPPPTQDTDLREGVAAAAAAAAAAPNDKDERAPVLAQVKGGAVVDINSREYAHWWFYNYGRGRGQKPPPPQPQPASSAVVK